MKVDQAVTFLFGVHFSLGAYYYSNGVTMTWNEAKQDCANRSMQLAKIDSQLELDNAVSYIHSVRVGSSLNDIWIGLKYDLTSNPNVYRWVSCEITQFTKWASAEPNYQTRDLCIRISSSSFEFKTIRCGNSYDYLCTDASPPYVHRNFSVVSSSFYNTAILECSYCSTPEIHSVQWKYNNGTNTQFINATTDIIKYGGSTIYSTALEIFNVSEIDIGSYECHVTNLKGTGIGLPINLNIVDLPIVITPTLSYAVDVDDSVILKCGFHAIPTATSVLWNIITETNSYRYSGTSSTRYSGATLTKPDLQIYNVTSQDTGNYTCEVTNSVGTTKSSLLQLKIIENNMESGPSCPCDCDFKAKLDYWASQNTTNHTLEELRIILAPILEELRANLTVDKSKLTKTKLKYTSAKDDRTSSAGIGTLGIVLITLLLCGLLIMDLTSVKRHITMAKMAGNYFK